MNTPLVIEHIAAGNELLDGRTCNTNTQMIGKYLTQHHHTLTYSTTVSDHEAPFKAVIETALSRADVILITGGLGPTDDDRTRDIVAESIQSPLIFHQDVFDTIQGWYASQDRSMPETNKKQAYFPEGAQIIENPNGTAPGFSVKTNQTTLIALPGVPSEMEHMLLSHVIPMLDPSDQQPLHRVHFATCGAGESLISDLLAPLYPLPDGVCLTYQAKFPEVFITLSFPEAFLPRGNALQTTIRSKLKDYIYSDSLKRLPEVLGDALKTTEKTLAIAESCTGGLIGHKLTSYPGASSFLLFDGVTYHNSAKASILGVSEATLEESGAVSSPCAKAMAEGACRVSGADIGLSTTGIAGPDGGTSDKPVGLVFIGISLQGKTEVRQLHLKGSRQRIQTMAAYHAMRLLLDHLTC